MARPRVHDVDVLLDRARSIILEHGIRAATMDAIAEASGAPIGSLYYGFHSRDDLLAQIWIRAARRSQHASIASEQRPDGEEAAVAAAMAIYDFCDQHREDARVLVSMRREDFIQREVSASLRRELQELNRPLEQAIAALARRLYGSSGPVERDRVLLAIFDLPYGAARRHIHRPGPFPPRRRKQLEAAVRAAVRAGRSGG